MRRVTFIASLAVLLTLTAAWWTNRTVSPKESSWDDVVAEADAGGYALITTEELANLREREASLLLVDTRQEWEYRAGHIDGAVLFPMEPTAWERWAKRNELATFLGPDKDRPIVFY
jgi:3-mercaptopyruvate sulfurtransferase SseA